MAEPLKTFFDRALVERIADMLVSSAPSFPRARFVREACNGLDDLELLERARHVMRALSRALPPDFEQASDVLLASLGPELARTEGFGMAPFLYLPHVLFVAEHGLECFERSMLLQKELTKRFSAEFSIRAFLERHPKRTLDALAVWAEDESPHVRRLVSEGTRPRLPWAPRLRALIEDPRPMLPLLERLKDDPSEYVRRSVANNLNDIGRDHPDVLIEVCRRWLEGASAARRRLVRHALRGAIKRGDRRAIALLGCEGTDGVRVEAVVKPRRVAIGGEVRIEVLVANDGDEARRVNVDLAVHFVKANGTTRPKVFKLRALELAPGARATLAKTVRLDQLTTRRHHAGRHRVDALLNGESVPLGAFQLRA